IAEVFVRMEADPTKPHVINQELIGLDRYRLFMGCPDNERLSAFAEDSLSFEEALRVAVHEEACPVCRCEITELRGFVQQSPARLFAEMPDWSTPFQARIGLQDRLNAELEQGQTRCVTLKGPSGMGKTRLLMETAIEQSFSHPDGVWYVPCGHVNSSDQLLAEIAAAAQLPRDLRGQGLETVSRRLAEKRALLVLDDVPADRDMVRFIGSLVENSSELHLLTTSKATLGLPGEKTLGLPPLDTRFEPHNDDPWSNDAFRFFASHVHTFDSDYPLAENRSQDAVREICAYTGGNPLGIELTAARGHELSPMEIADLLRREAPANGDFGLNGLLAWTYDLLARPEQRLLRNLGVFAGSFALEQVEFVCEEDGAQEILKTLVRNALVQPIKVGDLARYRLLDPVQVFARQRMQAEKSTRARQHALYFLGFAKRQAEKLDQRDQVEAMQALTMDLPNVRAAIQWAESADERFTAGSFGLALNRFFFLQGDWQEGVDGLRRAVRAFEVTKDALRYDRARLSLAGALTNKGEYDEAEALYTAVATEAIQRQETLLLAEARHGLGNIAQRRRRYSDASLWFEESLTGFLRVENTWLATVCRLNLSWVRARQGQFAEAQTLLTDCLPALRERGDRYPLGDALSNLGNIARMQGNWLEARGYYEECLQARQEVGYVSGIAAMINNIGETWQATGDHVRAEYCFADAARRFEQLGNRRDLAAVLANQGSLALDRSEKRRARERFEEALRLLQKTGDTHNAARVLRDLGRLAQSEGRLREAAGHYSESLLQFYRLGANPDIATTLFLYGKLKESQNAPRRAGLLLAMAHRMCVQFDLPEQADTHAALDTLEKRVGTEMLRQLTLQASTTSVEDIVALVADE
ncbi:MAG: tetratricopeptide repeat protein, partial [Chthonomonadaceae bacterium]|nr:tetratricopeptide repeat protein [Chthonomonadaceae bacterium]